MNPIILALLLMQPSDRLQVIEIEDKSISADVKALRDNLGKVGEQVKALAAQQSKADFSAIKEAVTQKEQPVPFPFPPQRSSQTLPGEEGREASWRPSAQPSRPLAARLLRPSRR